MGSRAVSVDLAVSVDTEKKGVPPDVDMEVWQVEMKVVQVEMTERPKRQASEGSYPYFPSYKVPTEL